MTAYVILKIKVIDQEKLKEYQQVAPLIIEKFGGKILVRGGEVATLDGAEESCRIVIIEFSNIEEAKEFYKSTEYQKAIELRKGAAQFESIAVEGLN